MATSLPGRSRKPSRYDLAYAGLRKIIETIDHYGLQEVKERILEFLAVQKQTCKKS